MDYRKASLELHKQLKGKIEVVSRVKVEDKNDLSLAYTPGVAEPCMAIHANPELSYELTRRWNTVAVVTDGSAVLGLGNIGPEAGMPVMEGKCVLFKEFGGIDAIPICLATQDVDQIVQTVYNLSPSFGGINLEDISAPRCFEVERRLKQLCPIPVFHDDQHGTAIVLAAAIINALKVVGKELNSAKIAMNGAGSAGIAIAEFLLKLGVYDIILCDRNGVLSEKTCFNDAQKDIAKRTNKSNVVGTLADAIKGADVFIGVSGPNMVNADMVKSMAQKPIVFAMANPTPEITPELALEAGAAVVGTGRSDYPNQVNNVLAFPGVFKGALDARASDINEEMQFAAAYALASLVGDELSSTHILPLPFDKRIATTVAQAVKTAAIKSGVARI